MKKKGKSSSVHFQSKFNLTQINPYKCLLIYINTTQEYAYLMFVITSIKVTYFVHSFLLYEFYCSPFKMGHTYVFLKIDVKKVKGWFEYDDGPILNELLIKIF